MANSSATLNNPFTGHEDIKTFREQADSGKSKLNSFAEDVSSKIETASLGYASAADAITSNWTSSDCKAKDQLAHINEAVTMRLLTSVKGDLVNIIGDIDTVSSNIKDIEDKYDKAKKYKPGCYMKDGNAVSSDTDGAVWKENDNDKIIKANQELPDLVAEAERQVQSIIDQAGTVKLGITESALSTGEFGPLVTYENDIVKREGKVSGFASVLSFAVGVVAGMLNDGENVVELVLTGVQSLLNLIPGFDGGVIDGLLDQARDSDFVEGILSSLVERLGGDMDSYENGKKWGSVGTMVACHFLGPVGNIIYGLSVLGKEVQQLKSDGKELTWENMMWPVIKSVGSAIADSSWLGMAGLFLLNTDVGADLVNNVVSMIFGGGSSGTNIFSGIGNFFSSAWEGVKGIWNRLTSGSS